MLMTYNVENLFDTVHDAGKNDYPRLPFKLKKTEKHKAICSKEKVDRYRDECLYLDWNNEVLKRKFERLTDVVKQVNNGKGADLLFLQEVENINVLNLWMDHSLKALGYKHVVLIEGPDERGIDTAFISKLELEGRPVLHQVKFQPINGLKNNDLSESRGILEATFKLPNGELLTAFSLHLPSQASPSEKRRQVLETLSQRARELPADRLKVAAGDFNITGLEEVREEMVAKYMLPDFLLSHKIGCNHCEGTHNHRGEWSFLDMMFFSKNLEMLEGKKGWSVIPESITTVSSSKYQIQGNSFTPSRFGEGQEITGVSDHLPLMAVLRLY
ncbi:MAG: endonuclease [Bdellovibrio sp.]